jgi:hypothetical protein
MKKKHILYFGLALVTMIGLQSCKTTKEVIEEQPENALAGITEVAFTNIASGYLTGYGAEGIEEGGRLINSQEEWERLTGMMNSVNQAIPEKSIDFEKNSVLVYFDEIRGSGGYSVEIVSVMIKGKMVEAQIKKAAPTGAAIEIMTQPFHSVSVPKMEGPVEFKVITE